MAKNKPNNSKNNKNSKNTKNDPQKKGASGSVAGLSAAVQEALSESYKKFSTKLGKKSGSHSESHMNDFFDFVEREHGKDLKSFLKTTTKSDRKIMFSMIAKKEFSGREIIENATSLSDRLESKITEKGAMEDVLKHLQKERGADFDDFLTTSYAGLGIDLKITKTSGIKSMRELKEAWRRYMGNKKPAKDVLERSELILENYSYYDMTEKMLATAALEKWKGTIVDKNLGATFDKKFPLPLDALQNIHRLRDLKAERNDFLMENQTIIDDKQRKRFDAVSISNKDVFDAAKKYNGLSSKQAAFIENKSMDDRPMQYSVMFDKIASQQFLHEFKNSIEVSEKKLDDIVSVFKDVPPTFAALFGEGSGFGTHDDDLRKVDPHFSQKIEKYNKTIKTMTEAGNSDEEIEKIEQERESLRRKVFLRQVQQKDSELGDILAYAHHKDFDLSSLDPGSQQKLANKLLEINLKKEQGSNALEDMYGLDRQKYEAFCRDLFDLSKTTATFPSPGGPITLNIEKKFQEMKIDKNSMNVRDLEKWNQLGLSFTIKDFDSEDGTENFLKMIYGRGNLFHKFRTEPEKKKKNGKEGEIDENYVAEGIMIHDGYKVGLTGPTVKNEVEGYLSLVGEGLAYEGEEEMRFLYSHPVNEHHPDRVLLEDDNGKPIMIPVKDEHKRNVNIKEKKLTLTGDAIGGLLMGYAILDNASEEFDLSKKPEPEVGKKIEALNDGFDDQYIDTRESREQTGKEIDDTITSDDEKDETEKINEKNQSIDDAWNALQPKGNKVPLAVGTSIRVQEGDLSEARELGEAGLGAPDFRHKFEIVEKNDNEVTFKLSGGCQSHDHEGIEKKYSLTPEFFERMTRLYKGQVFKMPPKKKGYESFNDTLTHMAEAGIPDVSKKLEPLVSSLGYDGTSLTVTRDGEKTEFEHFAVMVNEGEDMFRCKAQITENGKVKVTSEKWEVSQGDGKKEKKTITPLHYEKEMDYEAFLFFVADLGMTPHTKDQVEAFDQKKEKTNKDMSHQHRKGYSLSTFVGWGKKLFSGLGDKWKEYNELQIDELTDLASQDRKLQKKLSGLFPWREGWTTAWSKLDYDTRMDRAGKIFSKISAWRDIYAKEPDRSPVTGEIGEMLQKGPYPMLKRKHQVAGAFLFMCEKAGGMYARDMAPYAGTGLWVKALLGEGHHEEYMKKLRRAEARAKANPFDEDLRRAVSICEALYLNEAVDGADKVLIHRYGIEFADQIFGAYESSFGEEKINKTASSYVTAGQFSHKFDVKFMGDLRKLSPAKCLGALKACAMLAKSPQEVEKVKMGILMVMLSGMLQYSGDETSVKWLAKFSRKIGFLPGMWIEDYNHKGKVQRLLDLTTSGSFSKDTNLAYTVKQFSAGEYGGSINRKDEDFGRFPDRFRKRWFQNGNGSDVLKIIDMERINDEDAETIFSDKINGQKVEGSDRELLNELIDFSLSRSQEVDRETIREYFYGNPRTVPKAVLDSVFIGKLRGTTYTNATDEEEQSAERFWNSLQRSVPTYEMTDTTGKKVAFIVKKFFAFFGDQYYNGTDRTRFAKVLGIMKDNSGILAKSGNLAAERNFLITQAIEGPIAKKPIPQSIRNALLAFKQFFIKNIDAKDNAGLDVFNSDLIEEALDSSDARSNFLNPGLYIPGLGTDRKEVQAKEKELREDPNSALSKGSEFFNKELADLYNSLRQRGQQTGMGYPGSLLSRFGSASVGTKQQGIKIAQKAQKEVTSRLPGVLNPSGYGDHPGLKKEIARKVEEEKKALEAQKPDDKTGKKGSQQGDDDDDENNTVVDDEETVYDYA